MKFKEKELKNYEVTTCGRIFKNNIEIHKNLSKGHHYLYIGTNSKLYKILNERLKHRILAYCYFGDIKNKIIDHIDGNKLNNSKNNLRILDYSGNTLNSDKYYGIFKIYDIKNNKTYISDNVRKLSRETNISLKNTNIYKLLNKETKKSNKCKILELSENEIKNYKNKFNFWVEV